MMKKLVIVPICILFAINCVGEKKASEDALASALLLVAPVSTGSANTTTLSSGSVETTQTSGIHTTIVNASSTAEWVYVSLKESGKKTSSTSQWDLRFKRFVIGTNSGTSGTGSGGSCDTSKTNLSDANINAATCSLVIDSVQSQTGDGGFGNANDSASPSMFSWYNYDGSTHLLTSKGLVYLIMGSEGSLYRLQMLDYYSSAGTAGYMKFNWKSL